MGYLRKMKMFYTGFTSKIYFLLEINHNYKYIYLILTNIHNQIYVETTAKIKNN